MNNLTEFVDAGLLNKLLCNHCKNMLSVPPTFTTCLGHNICGRCETHCNEPLIANKQYDLLAQQFSFPCQNAIEGCTELLNFSKIKKHEQFCPYRPVDCLIENCMWSGIPIELIIHYKNVHSHLILEEDSVRELSEIKLRYLFVKSNHYFTIDYEYVNFHLNLKLNSLTYPNAGACFHCDLSNFRTCELIQSIPLDLGKEIITETTTNTQLFVINAQIPDCIQKCIKCPQCLQIMTPPILRCPSDHITCADCFDTFYNYCVTCEKDDLIFTRAYDLEMEAAFAMYNCQWAACRLTFSIRQIKEHEFNCNKRLYKCSYYCNDNWQGSLSQLVDHHPFCAKKYYYCSLQTSSVVTFICNNIPESKQFEFHLIAHKELFSLICDFEIWGIKISVINYAFPSIYGWFRYEVDLAHTEDPEFSANKTLQIRYRTCNIFSLDILGDDLLKFGGYDFLKITVRIILLNECDRKRNVDQIYKFYK